MPRSPSLPKEENIQIETKMQKTPKFLVYFPKHSSFTPPKAGEFFASNEFLGRSLYVYEGQLLSVDEFNAIPPHVFERDYYPERVHVAVILVDATEADLREMGDIAPAPAADEPAAETLAENPQEDTAGSKSETDDDGLLDALPDDKDQLLAYAESVGCKVDRRYSPRMIRRKIEEFLHEEELQAEAGGD